MRGVHLGLLSRSLLSTMSTWGSTVGRNLQFIGNTSLMSAAG